MKNSEILKQARVKANMSVKQISDILVSQGYKASEKTIYSWESGNSKPNIEILMRLCDIYGIKDILKTFGYDGYKEDGSIQLNMNETDIIEKYRSLDDSGKKHIDYELKRECDRVEEMEKLKKKFDTEFSSEIIPTRILSYYQKMASAGSGEYLFSEIPTDVIEVPDTPLSRKANFVLGVNGDSMESTYSDGDKVLVEKTHNVLIGEIGVFIREGECFIKEAGKDRLISHNEDKELYPDIIPDERRIDTVGRVLGKIGE